MFFLPLNSTQGGFYLSETLLWITSLCSGLQRNICAVKKEENTSDMLWFACLQCCSPRFVHSVHDQIMTRHQISHSDPGGKQTWQPTPDTTYAFQLVAKSIWQKVFSFIGCLRISELCCCRRADALQKSTFIGKYGSKDYYTWVFCF